MKRTEPTTDVLSRLAVPVIQAPMAGGPSTPALAAAVNRGGGLGFLAAGYLSPERLGEEIEATRAMTDRGFGVNVFVGGGNATKPDLVAAYARRLAPEAARAGVTLGQPRFDDDWFDDKLQLLCQRPVAVVSFTFGAPPQAAIDALQGARSEGWLTV